MIFSSRMSYKEALVSLPWNILKGGGLMRVLLTSILCKSGLMTHVLDLAYHLKTFGVQVSLALKSANPKERLGYQDWLSRLDNVPVFYYTTTADLALICERLEPQLPFTPLFQFFSNG